MYSDEKRPLNQTNVQTKPHNQSVFVHLRGFLFVFGQAGTRQTPSSVIWEVFLA